MENAKEYYDTRYDTRYLINSGLSIASRLD